MKEIRFSGWGGAWVECGCVHHACMAMTIKKL